MTHPDDAPAADAADRDRPVDPEPDTGPLPALPADADPADAVDQRIDAGDDDSYDR